MKKQLIINLLEFLETDNDNFEYKDIYPFLKQNNFTKPIYLSEDVDNDAEPAKSLINELLEEGLIEKSDNAIDNICNANWTNPIGNKRFQFWFDTYPVRLRLSNKGQAYLDEERLKNILSETNKSIQLSNQSAIKTNDLVRTNIKVQIAMGFITLVAIALTAIYTVRAYNKDDPKSLVQISKSMQQQEQLLDSLLILQKERNTFLKKEAKKTSPKKN